MAGSDAASQHANLRTTDSRSAHRLACPAGGCVAHASACSTVTVAVEGLQVVGELWQQPPVPLELEAQRLPDRQVVVDGLMQPRHASRFGQRRASVPSAWWSTLA